MKHYCMFSNMGNERVGKLLAAIRNEAEVGLKRPTLPYRLSRGLHEIAKKHPEVWDTAVREKVLDEVDEICAEQGWAKWGDFKGDEL